MTFGTMAAAHVTPSGPAVVATDNFNRANGAVGANWAAFGGYTTPQIVSNAVQSSAGVDYAATYTAANAGQDNMYAKIDAIVTTSDPTNDVMVLCRMPNDGTETGYFADSPAYIGQAWSLERMTNGSVTMLANASGSIAAGTHSVQVQAVGSTISILIDGVVPSGGSVTDSTHSGATKRYAGIHVYSDSTNRCSIDNFEMGTL